MGQIQRYFTSATTENELVITQGNSRIAYVQKKFLFSQQDIVSFHQLFRKMDKKGSGYITQANFFEFMDEELDSVVSPYVEYLFQLIEKEIENRVSFSEWLPAISLYCLYSNDSIVSFVFQLLDTDHDNFISKKELMNFLVQKRNGKKIFYYNYMKAVELLDIERPDKISLEQFRKIQVQIPFICYPAFRLQKTLRNKTFNNKYWDNLYDKILHKENEENKTKQLQKIQEEMRKKQQSKLDKKIEKFLQNTHLQHQSLPSIKQYHREYRRRNSDSMIPHNMQDRPDELIQNVYQHFSKQWIQNQRKLRELRVLRCKSKSLQYIKMPLKEIEFIQERPIPSNQFIRGSLSQQNINLRARQSRKSIFADVSKKFFKQQLLKKSNSKTIISSVSDLESEDKE